MRKKVWLARDRSGEYGLFKVKPNFLEKIGMYIGYDSRDGIIQDLCEDLTKTWLQLKNHLRKETCIQGYFNVSFKPIKKKK